VHAAGVDPQYASPGVAGFLVVFFLAVATYLLIRSMVGHLRKVRYDAELTEAQEAEALEAEARETEARERGGASRQGAPSADEARSDATQP
jgi:hypothetical protein